MKSTNTDESTRDQESVLAEEKKNFAGHLLALGQHYDLYALFDDFLSILLSCLSPGLKTGASADENTFHKVISKYRDRPGRLDFQQLAAVLIDEMEGRAFRKDGNDVLGDFYYFHLDPKKIPQPHIPRSLCDLAKCGKLQDGKSEPLNRRSNRRRIFDPACGSGRALVKAAKEEGWQHAYFGIDRDLMCVKMTALNLFLNGIHRAEVVCADAEGFRVGYRLSAVPFGIQRIDDGDTSDLWRLVTVNGLANLSTGQESIRIIPPALPFAA